MKTMRYVLSLALVFSATSLLAGEVTVKGVHLCCGACVRDVGKALTGVDGVSGAACDRDAKTVTFTAADEKAAQAGVDALAKAGFHGTAAHGDEAVAFPASGVKEGDKGAELKLSGVHLCCGGCVSAAKKALTPAADGAEIIIDRKAGTVTISGSDLDLAAIVAALNKAGFHGTSKK